MKESRVAAITGMHRSGTSAVASVLQRAGVEIGSQLIPGDAGNPHGYFEDEDFVRFHDELLARSGQRVLVQAGARLQPPRRQDVRRAEALIRRRCGAGLWGWKDPRTALYLDFWAERLPRAVFVFPFRGPFEVVLSLLRRGSGHEFEVMANPLTGLRAWRFYNDAILDFYRRHPDRCFLADVHEIFADAAGFVAAVAAKLDLPLCADSVADLIHSGELHRRPASKEAEAILERADPEAADLARRLAEAADWTGGAGPAPACAAAVAASLRRLRQMYDATADPQAVARPVFTLSLAFLDAAAVSGTSPGAQVLDLLDRIASFRQHAENLEAAAVRREGHVAQLEAHAGNLEARVSELSRHAANLEARVPELEAHGRGLESRLADLDSHRKGLEARLAELSQHAADLERVAAERAARAADLGDHAANLEALVAQQRQRSQELEAHAGNLEQLRSEEARHRGELERHAENLEALRRQDAERLAGYAAQVHGLEAHARNLEDLVSGQEVQLREFERHAANLEALRRQDADRLAALATHVDNLEQARAQERRQLQALDEHASALQRELALREARLAEAAAIAAAKEELERQLAARDDQLKELAAHHAGLLERLELREAAVTGLQGAARRLGGELEEALNDLRRLTSGWWPRLRRRFRRLL
jgi:Sulfotransferase family